jgi:hypothetical protein
MNALRTRHAGQWPGGDPDTLASARLITRAPGFYPPGNGGERYHAWNEQNMGAKLQALARERAQIIASAHEELAAKLAKLDDVHDRHMAVYAEHMRKARRHTSLLS